MKKMGLRLLGLLAIFLLFAQATAGIWTGNSFLYKPSQGARGEAEKNTFDSGLDRVDARLGKEKWVGDPSLGNTMAAAVAALGSNVAILRLAAGTHTLTANLTIPANIALAPENGAVIAIPTGKTLTINGGVQAGPWQIFDCAGTGAVKIAGPNRTILAEWFGASTGAADNSVAVAKAINAFQNGGGTLSFGWGIFLFTNPAVNAAAIIAGITFKGQGEGSQIFGTQPWHSTTLQYSGSTGALFRIFIPPAAVSCVGWKWQDLIIKCTSTGSAIEINDTTKDWNEAGANIMKCSWDNVTLYGNGGNFGIGAVDLFYSQTNQNFYVTGFKYGVYLKDSDGNKINGAALRNNQNVRLIRSSGSTAGNDNIVSMMMMELADYGESRYLVYDTAGHTKYAHSQYECGTGDAPFYVNGDSTVFENCRFGGGTGGRIGPNAIHTVFFNPVGGGSSSPWIVDAPASYSGTLDNGGDCMVYVYNPSDFYRSAIPVNPRIVIMADTNASGLADAAPRWRQAGGNALGAATHSLAAMMGQPGVHSTHFLINPFTKGHLGNTSFAGANPDDVSWVADADASTGWAFKLKKNATPPVTINRRFKVGTEINVGDTVAITVRYKASAAPTAGDTFLLAQGSVTGFLTYSAFPSTTVNYQTVTKIYTIPSLTAGEYLDLAIGHGLTNAGGDLLLYVDYVAIVPYAQTLRTRAVALEKQSVSYSATVTPDWSKGSFLAVGQLTGNVTVANPSVDAVQGQKVYLSLSADGSNRAITWGGKYKKAYTTVSANKQAVVEFMFDGTNYVQVGVVQEL